MENLTQHKWEQNDLPNTAGYMTDEEKLIRKLQDKGYTDQYKVEKGKLHDLTINKKYKPKEVKAVNFYRFEGASDPDDMAIMYAIETCDGRKGLLTDGYGVYADEDTGDFMQLVVINKKTTKE